LFKIESTVKYLNGNVAEFYYLLRTEDDHTFFLERGRE